MILRKLFGPKIKTDWRETKLKVHVSKRGLKRITDRNFAMSMGWKQIKYGVRNRLWQRVSVPIERQVKPISDLIKLIFTLKYNGRDDLL
jgi:hypothetical protein